MVSFKAAYGFGGLTYHLSNFISMWKQGVPLLDQTTMIFSNGKLSYYQPSSPNVALIVGVAAHGKALDNSSDPFGAKYPQTLSYGSSSDIAKYAILNSSWYDNYVPSEDDVYIFIPGYVTKDIVGVGGSTAVSGVVITNGDKIDDVIVSYQGIADLKDGRLDTDYAGYLGPKDNRTLDSSAWK